MRKAILTFVILGSVISGTAFAQNASDVQSSVDNLSDVFSKDVAARWKWKGDFRFRNENIEQGFSSTTRNRDRIRLRMSAVAAVNDNTKVEVGFTTTEIFKVVELSVLFDESQIICVCVVSIYGLRGSMAVVTAEDTADLVAALFI